MQDSLASSRCPIINHSLEPQEMYDNLSQQNHSGNERIKELIEFTNINYYNSQKIVEKEVSFISSQINLSANLLRNQINNQISSIKNKLIMSLNQKYKNANFEDENTTTLWQEEKKVIEQKFNLINNFTIDTLKDKYLNLKKLSSPMACSIDLITKVQSINDQQQTCRLDLSGLVNYDNLLGKKFGLLSKDKVVLLYERFFGRVCVLFLNIINIYGSTLASRQVKGIWSFYGHFTFGKNILIALRKRRDLFMLQLYNDELILVKEKIINFELIELLMNSNEIYVTTSSKKSSIRVFDMTFKEVTQFGQNTNSNKNFYLNGKVLTIDLENIYCQNETFISIISRKNGQLTKSLNFDFKFQSFLLNPERDFFIFFKNYNEIEVYSLEGDLVIKNLLNQQVFEQCFMSKCGHVMLTNTKSNKILIV